MNLSFYRANADYCDFLRKTDRCVPYTMDKKSTRPFVGILVIVNGINYYAPLSSPKPKHLKMKNQVDFRKINGGVWGSINFNNMIPIHKNSLMKIDINSLPSDTKADTEYKNLLSNQLSWCNKIENKERIITQATKLYNIIISKKGRPDLIARCCDFKTDELQYIIYCQTHHFSI